MLPGQDETNIDIDYIAQHGLEHICWPELLERVDNEKDFVSQLIQIFISDNAARVDEIILATDSGETDKLLRLVHSIKGAAYTVSANNLGRIAKEIETAAKKSNRFELNKLAETIDKEFCILKEIVTTEGWMEILDRVAY